MFFKKPQYDYAVFGLGNPGEKYAFTRHNAGFLTLDYIAQKENVEFTKKLKKSYYTPCIIGNKKVVLAKPQTYMNNSGEAVVELMNYFNIPKDKIIIVYDDTALDTAKIRIRDKGSAGGHNGIKSIISSLGSDEFLRIRIGVGENKFDDIADWVLSRFSKEEEKLLFDKFSQIQDALSVLIEKGLNEAQNRYN